MVAFFYFGKNYEATRVGRWDISVVCEKCGCAYFYQLTRIGTGTATAAYGIGSGKAARSAQEKSKSDLQERLLAEADLVPCPKCHWISEDLIQGYRRGCFRGLTPTAWGLGVLGTVVTLLSGLYVFFGSPRDRHLAPYFFVGGPLLSAALVAGLLLLQFSLRRMIRPNRNYPAPPRVPVSTPPALLKDEASGDLYVAETDQNHQGWLDFHVGRDRLPPKCCVCLQRAHKEDVYLVETGDKELKIPYCEACADNPKAAKRNRWLLAAAFTVLIAGVAIPPFLVGASAITPVILGVLLVMVPVILYIARQRAAPVDAIIVDATRGVVRLRFLNPEYARLVAENRDTSTPIEPVDG